MKSYFAFRLSEGCWPVCLSKGFHNETQANLCLSQAAEFGCVFGEAVGHGENKHYACASIMKNLKYFLVFVPYGASL